MPEHHLVSIVTPSYNQSRYIEETIQSVLLQDYPAIEYLIIDGGSTDGSVEIIRRYATRLSYWVSEPDVGQADAINKGWQRARGDIIAYINSDDLYLPGAIHRAVHYFEQHPEVGIVCGACQLIGKDGKPLRAPVEVPEISLEWLLRYPLPQPAVFFRRSVIEQIGLLDPALHYVLDWEFCIRAAMTGIPIARLMGSPIACFRCWESQKTNNSFMHQIEEQVLVRDRLLLNPQVSATLAKAITFSKAWAFLWPAYQHYLRGQMGSARNLLRLAVTFDRRIAIHPEFLGLYARALLGYRFSMYARNIKSSLSRNKFGCN